MFLATCLKSGRPVAVKVVDKNALNDTQEACVRRELSNQARLWHHNVVPLLVRRPSVDLKLSCQLFCNMQLHLSYNYIVVFCACYN